MKPVDYLLLAAVALALALAVYLRRRAKHRGTGCCGSCEGCCTCGQNKTK